MKREIIFGEIPGIEEYHWFEGRKEMMPSSFHRKWGAGIDGNGREGTAAIVLSGGYEDDVDLGDEIIYTGAGGNDSSTGRQIKDQDWENAGNAGLLKSMNEGLPVRVIRGSNHKSSLSPKIGYNYAGLYSVVDAWEEMGNSGYRICRFRLIYVGNNPQRKIPKEVELDYTNKEGKKREITISRTIRDTKISRNIKRIYNYECQICGTTILLKSSRYAEGAHIRPLGKPHNGDDNTNNLLCLCPNHHVMFDKGCFSITNDLELLGSETGILKMHSNHILNKSNLEYHRKCHGYD